jgi:hypothetical protein
MSHHVSSFLRLIPGSDVGNRLRILLLLFRPSIPHNLFYIVFEIDTFHYSCKHWMLVCSIFRLNLHSDPL